MARFNDVEVTVDSILKNECPRGYKVGDKWLVKGGNTPQTEMCASAYNSIAPALRVLCMGGNHPWDSESGESAAMCPDSNVGLIFKLRRIESE
ncbi:MAG: TIGR04076 family protein [Dehalococcoidales bacterium]|nr:MAG: TIGR04076 family protein [Dehalococcoidales bacterium]